MRGQAYTLEAIVAAIIIVSALLFALQVTAVTPLSASTSNQHIENQQQSVAAGALAAASETSVDVDGTEMSALKEAVLYCDVDTDAPGFYDADVPPVYTNRNPSHAFGRILNRSFGTGIALNVELHPEGGGDSVPMVEHGNPSDNAVTASRTVMVYDDDPVSSPGSISTVGDLEHENCIPVPEDDTASGPVYSVVRVEVTVWRM